MHQKNEFDSGVEFFCVFTKAAVGWFKTAHAAFTHKKEYIIKKNMM
jgi:hypothetical protein